MQEIGDRFQMKTFLKIIKFLKRKLNFVYWNGSLSYLGLEMGGDVTKKLKAIDWLRAIRFLEQ